MIAVVIGATGLTGSALLHRLLEDSAFNQVIVVSRTAIAIHSPKLRQIVQAFDTLCVLEGHFVADVAFCCLGTTLKKAGSEKAFVQVDLDYVLDFAHICQQNGVQHFLQISSIGANAQSTYLYLQTKGRMEEGLRNLDFAAVTVFRPSVLVGKRDQLRLGEYLSIVLLKWFGFVLRGRFRKYRATNVEKLALLMCFFARQFTQGFNIVENDRIIDS